MSDQEGKERRAVMQEVADGLDGSLDWVFWCIAAGAVLGIIEWWVGPW